MFKVWSLSAAFAALGCVVAACDDNEARPPVSGLDADGGTKTDSGNPSAQDAGTEDAAIDEDAGADGSTSADTGVDAATSLGCSGGAPLAIAGLYLESNGTQHWFKRTATSVNYTRVPSGPANNASPPVLFRVTQVCSDQKVFIAQSEAGTFSRVDWSDASGLAICIAVDGAADAATALAAPVPTPGSATGCKGAAWLSLGKKDGGV